MYCGELQSYDALFLTHRLSLLPISLFCLRYSPKATSLKAISPALLMSRAASRLKKGQLLQAGSDLANALAMQSASAGHDPSSQLPSWGGAAEEAGAEEAGRHVRQGLSSALGYYRAQVRFEDLFLVRLTD